MRRREFITLLGGAAVAWPLAARAQQPGSVRRIGVLHTPAADDPEGQVRNAALIRGLAQFGWTDGGNVRIETGDAFFFRVSTRLVALAEQHSVAAMFGTREFVDAGGLMSYAASWPMRIARRVTMSAASSRVRSQATCRSCNRANSSW